MDAAQPHQAALEGRGNPRDGGGGRRDAAPVLVAEGEMEDQVAHGVEAAAGERPGARGADAADGAEGSLEIQRAAQGAYAPSKRRMTTPQRSSSPCRISPGMPVSIRRPLRKVLFMVPISSPKKNLLPRR